MPVQKLLAKIHIAKKDLSLDDETYREILSSEFGVRSSKFLDNEKALKLIRLFKEKGWSPYAKASADKQPKPKKFDDQKGDIYSATPAQKRMIEAMWHDIYRGNEETKHLRQFLFNHFKVSDIRFLEKDTTAHQAIEALKAMQHRRTANE